MKPEIKYKGQGKYYNCLVIKQPYAELIRQEKKVIELRNNYTTYRGEFLIISEKNTQVNGLPIRQVIAKADLYLVTRVKEEHRGRVAVDHNKPLYGYSWWLKNIVPIKPVPARVRDDYYGIFKLWFFNGSIKKDWKRLIKNKLFAIWNG